MSRLKRYFLLALLAPSFLFLPPFAATADRTGSMTPQDVATALTGGQILGDVVLTGNVVQFVGPDEKRGTVVIRARATGESRIDLSLEDGRHTEVFGFSGGLPACYWAGPDGEQHQIPRHNCLVGLAWLVPSVSLNPGAFRGDVSAAYVGSGTFDGFPVERFRYEFRPKNQKPNITQWVSRLGAVDIEVGATARLPLRLLYSAHADNNADVDIPVEVRFADFRSVRGVVVPHRIAKLISGGLTLHIEITDVLINSGIPDGDFFVPEEK